MKTYARSAFAVVPLLALLACSSNTTSNPELPAPADFPPTASSNSAQFSPSAGILPLPNVLLTAAVTAPVVPVAGVPLAPDKALAWINQNEVGNTNAVSGLSSAIKFTFDDPIAQSSVNAATVKVFLALPDADGTENGKLGFRDVSPLFTYEFRKNGTGVDGAGLQLIPRLPLPAGSRFVYVITDGVKDAASGKAVRSALLFNYLKYSKPLNDLSDPANPAAWLGAATTGDLEKIRGNATSGTNILLSGYAKTMDDLIASAAADASGKAAAGAGATTIGSRDSIRIMGRFITSGAMATRLVSDNAASQIPVEGALWAWANNAPGTPFAAAPAKQWNNGVTVGGMGVGQFLGSTLVNAFWAQLPAPLNQAPHAAVGYIALGTFQSGDLNIDPAVAATATKPPTGDLTGTTGAYNPGYYPSDPVTGAPNGAPVPGTGVLQGVRPDGKTLTGFLHVSRNVPFLFVAPITPAPAGGYPVLIYQHGITSQKEDILAAANTICAAGYAVIAIDAPLHGGVANGRNSKEWGANFMSLLSILNTRTNIQQGGFNLWRLEKVVKTGGTGSLQEVCTAAGKPIASTGASKFLGHSLGTILGSYFLAGNSNQYGLPGASNLPALLSAPGARAAYIIRDSPAGFAVAARAGLAAGGVATDSHAYDQYFMLVQSIVDVADPSWSLGSIKTVSGLPVPSRLAGRVLVQEAIGDNTIPNTYGRHFGNSLGGWGALGSAAFDIAPNFTQIRNAGAASPTVPFMLAAGGLKASAAPATSPVAGPTEGLFQFGSTSSAASHGMLLDGSAYTPAAQKQLYIWLLTGRVADPADTTNWPSSAWINDAVQMPRIPWPMAE
jgi:hypothetical protein